MTEDELLDPLRLDARIRRAQQSLAAWRRELAAGRPSEWSGHRDVSTKTLFETLEGRDDPVAQGARPWVYALTLERVLAVDWVRLELAWRSPVVVLEKPEHEETSMAELLRRVLSPSESTARREAFASALAGAPPLASDAARIWADRRREATRRLVGDDGPRYEFPVQPRRDLEHAATSLLDATDELVEPRDTWHDALLDSVAPRATEGWPAQMSPRWLHDLFGSTGLCDGLELSLGELPPVLGATSFCRALAVFGEAYAAADVPPTAPFVVSRHPFDTRLARRAALFGALPADPTFTRVALGLGRSRALEQARHVARALLFELRLRAVRVLAASNQQAELSERKAHFEALSERAVGAALPGSLVGLVPRLVPSDPTTLIGGLMAISDARRLRERFDEDWFRNPRAAAALREEQSELPISAEHGVHPLGHVVLGPELGAAVREARAALVELGL